MRKIRFSIVASLAMVWATAQQTPDNFMFSPNAEPPSVIPSSPEAGTLGRYGSVPLSASSGQMSHSVPFHTIQVDGNSWPVGLSYSFSGLLLEGKPSLMGLGWSLNGEAAVTREVRGLPDESLYGYRGSLSLIPNKTVKNLIDDYMALERDGNANTSGWDAWNLNTLDNFRDGRYDAEVDKYTVNVGGLHFSFKLTNYVHDPNNHNVISAEPYFLSKHANKVAVEWATPDLDSPENSYVKAFEVTDTNGIVYRFDVLEKTVPQGRDFELQPRVITAWKLSSISYINGQEITFDYRLDNYTDFTYRVAGGAVRTNVGGLSPNPNGYEYGDFQPGEEVFVNPSYGESIVEGEIERQVLDQIHFPKGRIDINYLPKINNRLLVGSLELFSQENGTNPVRTFAFSYHGPRDLLDAITHNGEHHYAFEYYEDVIAVPPFIASVNDKPLVRQQDDWRYYNGANNPFGLNIPNSHYENVDKNPDTKYCRAGGLKRIIYPTRGSTYINYEPNTVKEPFLLDDQYYNSLPYTRSFNFIFEPSKHTYEDGYVEVIKEFTFEEPTMAYITTTIEGERCANQILLSLSRKDGQVTYRNSYEGSTIPEYPGANKNYYDVVPWVKGKLQELNFPWVIPRMYPNYFEEYGPDDGACGYNIIQEESIHKMLIMPGTYIFRGYSSVFGTTAKGTIKIDIYGEFNEAPPEYINKIVGGLRVDYTKDCPDGSGNNCTITDYDYNDAEGFSTGYGYVKPLQDIEYGLNVTEDENGNNTPGGIVTRRVTLKTILSTPFTVSDPAIGTPVFYRQIRNILRKNGSVRPTTTEIGHTVSEYSIPFEDIAFTYPPHPRGKDLDKSLPTSAHTYRQDEEEPVTLSTTTYQPIRKLLQGNTGQDNDNNHPWSLIVHLRQIRDVDFTRNDYSNSDPPIGSPDDIAIKQLHGIQPYREVDIWDRAQAVTTSKDGISATTTYHYNSNFKVDSLYTQDSRGNTIAVKTQYANDFSELNGMKNNNQLSTPVQVWHYYNGALQGTQKTTFVANAYGYRPERVYTAKGNGPLEARLGYHYDTQGRIVQVDRLVGDSNNPNPKVLSSTSYVWGYAGSSYPVLKVDQATRSDITGAGADLSVLRSAQSSITAKETQLNTLRNALPNALVSGYAHQPLVGMAATIDPRGYTTHYAYENQNRLESVKDQQQHLLAEYEYGIRSTDHASLADPDDPFPEMTATLNGPATVAYGDTASYTLTIAGGSANYAVVWHQDGNFLGDNLTGHTLTFTRVGRSTLEVTVTDNLTGAQLQLQQPILAEAAIGAIVPSRAHFVTNSAVTFTAPTIAGVGNDVTYNWTLDGNSVANGTTLNDLTLGGQYFPMIRPYPIVLEVTDNASGITTLSDAAVVQAYAPLAIATINASTTDAVVNTTVNFTATGASGGSSDKSGQWYVDGTPVSGATGNSFSSIFTLGSHTITYRLQDNKITTTSGTPYFTEKSVAIDVHPELAISGPVLAPASPIMVNSNVNFDVNILDGSGHYSYNWLYKSLTVSTTKSFTLNVGYEYYGNHLLFCLVTDLKTGLTESVSSTVTVNGAPTLWSNQRVEQTFVNNNYEYSARIGLGGLNGSGDYSYSWVVGGVSQGTGPDATIDLDCNQTQVQVVCHLTDNITGQQHTSNKIYTFSGNCGGGGGGGGGNNNQ